MTADEVFDLPRTTPTHEAGHIAMAWLRWGDQAIRGPVTCVETAWTLGSADIWIENPRDEYWREALSHVPFGLPIANALRDWAEDTVQVLQAGDIAVERGDRRGLFKLPPPGIRLPERPEQVRLIAEAKARGESEPSSDKENVKAILGQLSATPEAAEHWRLWLLERTWTLAARPIFDRLVDAIADALRVHDTLSRDEVLAIIHAVTDPPPPEPHPAASGYYA